jgi:hypothetical protein
VPVRPPGRPLQIVDARLVAFACYLNHALYSSATYQSTNLLIYLS